MALSDKDRIFTNLYGYQPWNVDAAGLQAARAPVGRAAAAWRRRSRACVQRGKMRWSKRSTASKA